MSLVGDTEAATKAAECRQMRNIFPLKFVTLCGNHDDNDADEQLLALKELTRDLAELVTK
jgi:hypothetical protein